VVGRRRREGVEIGDAPVGGHDRRDRDEVGGPVDRRRHLRQRHGAHGHAAAGLREKGPQHRREVPVGAEDRGSVAQARRHHARERGDLGADRYPCGGNADEGGEGRAAAGDVRVVSGRVEPSRRPLPERHAQRCERRPRRKPERRRVEMAADGLERGVDAGGKRIGHGCDAPTSSRVPQLARAEPLGPGAQLQRQPPELPGRAQRREVADAPGR
jgi:hypothetical protein